MQRLCIQHAKYKKSIWEIRSCGNGISFSAESLFTFNCSEEIVSRNWIERRNWIQLNWEWTEQSRAEQNEINIWSARRFSEWQKNIPESNWCHIIDWGYQWNTMHSLPNSSDFLLSLRLTCHTFIHQKWLIHESYLTLLNWSIRTIVYITWANEYGI